MDIRGKLFTLFQDCNNPSWKWFPNNAEMMKLIDYLIDNGVTVQENVEISDELLNQLKNAPITICKEEPSIELVQEWISVKDRLPESKELVLCIWKDINGIYYGFARYQHDNVWYVSNEGMPEVTHWMALPKKPKPPKGE